VLIHSGNSCLLYYVLPIKLDGVLNCPLTCDSCETVYFIDVILHQVNTLTFIFYFPV